MLTHQLLVYADYIIYSVKTYKNALLVAHNYISLEENSEKIKYMFTFPEENAGWVQNPFKALQVQIIGNSKKLKLH
jgi:hypothetical protein